MIIIFEGADNCGKSTIAKAFANRMNYDYFKMNEKDLITKVDPKTVQAIHAYQLNFFYQLANQVDFDIVMDRFYPSEWVYGSLFREVDERVIWEHDKLFAGLKTKIVICSKENSKLEDELWDNEQLSRINAKYAEFATKTNCDVLRLETDDENLEEQIGDIIAFINR